MGRVVDLHTVDIESYYDREYSLSRLSTEDYVYDDGFEIMLVSHKLNDGETEWFSSPHMEDYREWLMDKGVHRGVFLAHNSMFDGLILKRLSIPTPPLLCDTLCMAQAILKPRFRSISLDSCLKNTNSPFRKQGYVANMIGRRLASLTSQELRDYADYCVNDTDGTYWLFNHMKGQLPRSEFEVIDSTLRMYLDPSFILDPLTLKGLVEDEKAKTIRLLEALPKDITRIQLSSNPQFAKLLEERLGIEPPTKISPTTGKTTYAFAKNDEEWKDLEDEWGDDPVVGAVLAARLGVKSTIAESRAKRFLDIAEQHGKLRVPLKYYGAHTGRYSGMQKINCQNLSRIDYKNPSRNQLRFALRAPKGFKVVSIDLAQIEARINAWLSGCTELLNVFATGGDPYCAFATKIYRRKITKADKAERFVGKTCLTADTRVLTHRGFVPIIAVKSTDLLWDGQKWVQHAGVVSQGVKPTVRAFGLGATLDHEIHMAASKAEWREVLRNYSHLLSAISEAGGLYEPSLILRRDTIPSASASVETWQSLIDTTYSQVNQLAAIHVLKSKQQKNDTSSTRPPYQTKDTVVDSSTDSLRKLTDVTARRTKATLITAFEALKCIVGGETTVRSFLNMSKPCRDGTTPIWKSIESMLTGIMNPVISSLSPADKTFLTGEKSQHCSLNLTSYENAYDIANAGPDHRFTILTSLGPITVSNCLLGLGYGMGAAKLKATFRKDGMKISLPTAQEYIYTYRDSYHEIPATWRFCDDLLTKIYDGGLVPIGPCMGTKDRITLPNGMAIWYHNLRWIEDSKYRGWVFDYAGRTKKIWGGTIVENLCQSLARIILMEHATEIRQETGYRPKLNVHDELVYIVRETEAEDFLIAGEAIMHKAADWAAGLPVAAEGSMGDTYGDCK